ncbi:MAG: LLM class flavin-dependent oxidoreductase [Corynebacterium sp.]|nr:LLM class flavin-dependent oxidoreductase [Corynebacterium sp.]
MNDLIGHRLELEFNGAKLSVLDFARIFDGETPGKSFERSVQFAQHAEQLGFSRVWYAEHHNMPTIASSSPAILIAHVAAHTEYIRLGAGGIMLPNHSPYIIAEQFGMLAELHPGRIDLGLGRAPGTDQNTLGRALRRSPAAAEHFPEDIIELQRYLTDDSQIPGVRAIPGAGTNVPLYILGSSLFGARLAAKLGLPYAFASHFAPTHLDEAIETYRAEFQPSAILDKPYIIAAMNVVAADTSKHAEEQWQAVRRKWVRNMLNTKVPISEAQLTEFMESYGAQQILDMLRYTAHGDKAEVHTQIAQFQQRTGTDELMLTFQGPRWTDALHSMQLVAEGSKELS